MARRTTLFAWIAIGWLFLAALAALQFWPAVPHTKLGWVAFMVVAPPLWILGEAVSEWVWSSRAGRAVSEHPSSAFRIIVGAAIGALLIAVWLAASWRFGFDV